MQKTSTSNLVLPKVGWPEFEIAWETRFGDDLNLVGHSGDRKYSPFTVQVPTVGQYWLTDWSMTSEEEFRAKVAGKKLAILVGCMDKRYARPLYDWALSESRGRLLIPFFVAAGICQSCHSVRPIAMAQMLEWLCNNADVTKIFASGHACNCGGLAYIHNQTTVCNGLSCNAGDQKEINFVSGQINEGVAACIPQPYLRVTQKVLVTEKGTKTLFLKLR